MRKLLIIAAMLLSAFAINAQTVQVQPDSITAALTGCERSYARYRDEQGEDWPVFLSADRQEIFYVRTIPGEFSVSHFEFVTVERRMTWKTKTTPSTVSN
jgi:hypothetical protein